MALKVQKFAMRCARVSDCGPNAGDTLERADWGAVLVARATLKVSAYAVLRPVVWRYAVKRLLQYEGALVRLRARW